MNKSFYDKIAMEWTSARNRSFISRLVMEFADKIIPQGDILDIGCGHGFLTQYLCEKNFQVTGIDFSEKMIEIAKGQKIRDADFITGDFFVFKSPDKFDGVLAWDSLFHFPKERQKEIYSKVGGFLNPGGYLLFTHGDIDDEHTDEMMDEPFYYSCLPKNEVCQTLADNGFEIEYAYTNFIEKKEHRALVILAKKEK